MFRSRSSPAVRAALSAACAGVALAGCFLGQPVVRGEPSGEPAAGFAHAASYRVSCSVSDECRVTYIDESGELRSRDITGEWQLDLGVNDGGRLWVRAGAGGCPPRPVRVEIHVDGASVAEDLERPPGGARCEWILAETEFRVP